MIAEKTNTIVDRINEIDNDFEKQVESYKKIKNELDSLLHEIEPKKQTSVKKSIDEMLATAHMCGVPALRKKLDLDRNKEMNIHGENIELISDHLFPYEDEMLFDKVKETKKILIRLGRLYVIKRSYEIEKEDE